MKYQRYKDEQRCPFNKQNELFLSHQLFKTPSLHSPHVAYQFDFLIGGRANGDEVDVEAGQTADAPTKEERGDDETHGGGVATHRVEQRGADGVADERVERGDEDVEDEDGSEDEEVEEVAIVAHANACVGPRTNDKKSRTSSIK